MGMRLRRAKKAEPEEDSEAYLAAQELVDTHPLKDAATSAMQQVRTAIYDLETVIEEADVHRRTLDADATTYSNSGISIGFAFISAPAAVAFTFHGLMPRHSVIIGMSAVLSLALMLGIFWGQLDGFKSSMRGVRSWEKLARNARRRLNAFKLRRDDLQDQANTPAPGASRGFFRHR